MRRRIIGRLAEGPLAVGQIASGMPIGRSAVSMHLSVLKTARLVEDQAVGNRRIYCLETGTLRKLRDHIEWYWGRSLDAFQTAAEAKAREMIVSAEQEIVVAKSVRVDAPLAVAFDVFIKQDWWPVETHHLAEPPGREVILEPFQGGRWYERASDGTETDWGIVLEWQPPHRLVLTWQVNPGWTYEEDPGRAAEIEVTFTQDDTNVTRVDLIHRHLERYGAAAERMRRILDGKGGEPLTAFARHLASQPNSRMKEKR